jgi:outer membrane protein OmpA-like peptidoglycan-associated protein
MKKTYISALALAAALVAAPFATAHADETPGWYVGAGVGANQNTDSTTHTTPGHNDIDFDPGYNLNGAGGYIWNNGLRLEGEAWRSHADVNKVYTSGGKNGHLTNTDVFANAYYDMNTGKLFGMPSMFTPYVGAGVGGAIVDADHIGVLNNGGQLNGNNLELAYQAIGGVAAQLDANWAVTADYRYVATVDPKFHETTGRGAYTDNASHNVVIGVRYSFDTPTYTPVQSMAPAPRPMAKVAPKPAVAPVPQSFMVFFDFNKSDLTPEAKRILASAADEFKRGGFVKIVVTGHTDTVGGAAYNMKLSDRRAMAVKTELEHLGVAAQTVQTVGDGKNGLMVPTADGVREAQNRRAEIVFDKQ